MKLKERLKSPVPRLIKKVQKISGAVGGLLTVLALMSTNYPTLNIPTWLWEVALAGTVISHLILQLTTENDFQSQSNEGKETA